MTECRDWPSTLWASSYNGVPFFFEREESSGGRDIAVHEFPGGDDPFLEDMGRKTRAFSGTCYLASDDVDTQAIALENVFETEGTGTLVLPLFGPVQVRCAEFTRSFDKDKLGYLAYSVRFIREGAPAPVISVPLLGQQVFDSVDAVASSLANIFPGALVANNPADYVLQAAIDAVRSVATAIELIRTAYPVDAAISPRVAAATAAIADAAPLLIASAGAPDPGDVATLLAATPELDETFSDPSANLAAAIIATVRLLGDGMAGNIDAGAGALLSLALDFPPPSVPPQLSANAAAADANAAAIYALARVAALSAWCEALQRQTYNSRPDGVAARAAVAERIGDELANWGGSDNFEIYIALQDLQGATVQFLTSLIANLAPVVTVAASQPMPALWWAHRLYGDPSRAVDLVLRNGVGHPSFMPLQFAALAPDFKAPASLPTTWPAA
jgi:prophage DNA circulation protein